MNNDCFNMKMRGGGNNKRGLPPTATNFYGLTLYHLRAKAGQPEQSKPIHIGGAVTANGNPLMEPDLHNVVIIPSGTGVGDENTCGAILSDPSATGPPQLYGRPYGKITQLHGLLGPDSLDNPNPSAYQLLP